MVLVEDTIYNWVRSRISRRVPCVISYNYYSGLLEFASMGSEEVLDVGKLAKPSIAEVSGIVKRAIEGEYGELRLAGASFCEEAYENERVRARFFASLGVVRITVVPK